LITSISTIYFVRSVGHDDTVPNTFFDLRRYGRASPATPLDPGMALGASTWTKVPNVSGAVPPLIFQLGPRPGPVPQRLARHALCCLMGLGAASHAGSRCRVGSCSGDVTVRLRALLAALAICGSGFTVFNLQTGSDWKCRRMTRTDQRGKAGPFRVGRPNVALW